MKRYLACLILIVIFLCIPVSAATYTSEYPPAQSSTYVVSTTKLGVQYEAYFGTDPALSVTGSYVDNSWISSASPNRFSIDLGSGKYIRRIYYENLHASGAGTLNGVKDFKIYGSNTAGDFADTTYASTGSWVEITPSQTYFDQHVAANTADPKYITLSNTESYRYYSFKFANNYAADANMGFRRVELQTEDGWSPATTSSFTANVTSGISPLSVRFMDTSTGPTITTYNWSYQGIAAGNNTLTIFSTTKNANVSFYVGNFSIKHGVSGASGSNISTQKTWINVSAYPSVLANFTANTTTPIIYPGAVLFTDSSTPSGIGGMQWLWNFGDGTTATTQNPTHVYATSGLKTVSLTVSEIANVSNTNTMTKTNYINATYSEFYLDPNFVGNPLRGAPGLLASFTDTSIYGMTNMSAPKTCNWSFGDSGSLTPFSSTCGVVQHVYTYAGIYDVNLTITTYGNTSYELKQQYIVISSDTDYLMKYPPAQITFHVQEFFGKPIPGATVYATGIMTSTGNWDWVAQLLGYPLEEIPFNVDEMNMTTDSGGDATFLMINSVKYNITVVKSGYTFPSTIISPSEKWYPIIANYNGTPWFESGNNTVADVNVTVSSTMVNSTYGRIRINYDDTLHSTTGGTITIFEGNLNRSTVVLTMPITGNTFWNSTDVPRGDGKSYTIQVSATNNLSPDPYVRTFTAALKPQPVQIPGFSQTMLLWLALFFIIFTAAFSGAVHAPQMAIIICIESWVFWAIGWLEPLSLEFSTGELGVIGMLSLATVMAVIWNFREGKRKEKGT